MYINGLSLFAFHAADPEAASAQDGELRAILWARTGERKAEPFHLKLAKEIF